MIRVLAIAVLMAMPVFAGTEIDLTINDPRTIEMAGASAAWAIDTSVVDVIAQNGQVHLFGRSAGKTIVVVVSLTGQSSFEVRVVPRPDTVSAASLSARPEQGVAELRYSSAAAELQSAITMRRESRTGRSEAVARVVHHPSGPMGTRAKTSIATASYRIFTRRRELTLFDRDVDHSPLTLRNTPVRGIHYLDDHWRLHAGYTAYVMYESFLIPRERQVVAGAGYELRTGARSTLTPSVFAYRGEGSVLSMRYRFEGGEHLTASAELGYSNQSAGAAAQLEYNSSRNRVHADFRYRPDTFASVAGNPPGFFGDASWSHHYGRGSNASAIVSVTDTAGTRVRFVSADADHRLTEVLSLTGGVSRASFAGAQSVAIPAGFRFDFARAGFGAIYRYAKTPASRGSYGVRVFGRASLGRLSLNASAERQRNAPTLELIFAERPDLALSLRELGITATTPEDVARALRENSVLADLGFIEGLTLDFAPMRTQVAFQAAWLGSSSRRQIRGKFLYNVIEGVSSRNATKIASLTYAQQLTSTTDGFASYSWWRTERRGTETRTQNIVEVGLRHRFDGLPSPFGSTGTIRGTVVVDEDLDGRSDGAGIAAVIELDGSRVARTNPDGSFVFDRVSRGSHRVVARIVDRPEAYFTTPSRVEVEAGEQLVFGVATTAARLIASVKSDAGVGIPGVRLMLTRGATQRLAMTKSDGTFVIAAPPGEWQLSLIPDSVPAGHALEGTESRTLLLDRATPVQTSYLLQALRSIDGRGAAADATIVIPQLGRTVRADAHGRFSIRSLPAGELTLISNGVERHVVMPVGPGTIDVDLGSER